MASAKRRRVEVDAMSFELSTVRQREQLPQWVADAITLPVSFSKEELFGKVQEFATAIGDVAKLGALSKLDENYEKLREEQCHYLTDRFGYTPALSVNGLPRDRWGERLCGQDGVDRTGWRKWIVVALFKGQPFGAVFVFYDPRVPNSLWMQGIAQFDVPAHYRLCSGNHLEPTLNDRLLPAVQSLARELNCTYVYSNPVYGQDKRLLEFGFERAPLPAESGPPICEFCDRGMGFCLTVK